MRIFIAGASRGLGLGLCAAYRERGDEVIAACRRATPELQALGIRVLEGIELTDDRAVARLPSAVPGPLDALIYNAGVNEDAASMEGIDPSGLAAVYDVNTLGAVRVVLALLPLLANPSKIMFLGTGSPALNVNVPSAGNYGYRMSKAALTSFGFGLARDLRHRGVAVLIGGPGPVDSDMLRKVAAEGRTSFDPNQAPSPRHVARQLRDRLDELTLAASPAWHEDADGTPVLLPGSRAPGAGHESAAAAQASD